MFMQQDRKQPEEVHSSTGQAYPWLAGNGIGS